MFDLGGLTDLFATETNAIVWSEGCVQAPAVVLRSGHPKRDLGTPEKVFESGRC